MKTSQEHDKSLNRALIRVKSSIAKERAVIEALDNIEIFIRDFNSNDKVQKARYAPSIRAVIKHIYSNNYTDSSMETLSRRLRYLKRDIEDLEASNISLKEEEKIRKEIREANQFRIRLLNFKTLQEKSKYVAEFVGKTDKEIEEMHKKMCNIGAKANLRLSESRNYLGTKSILERIYSKYKAEYDKYTEGLNLIRKELNRSKVKDIISKAIDIVQKNGLEVQLAVANITWLQKPELLPEYITEDMELWRQLHVDGYTESEEETESTEDDTEETQIDNEEDEESFMKLDSNVETLDDFSSSNKRLSRAIDDIIKIDFEIYTNNNKIIKQAMDNGMTFKEMATFKSKDKDSYKIRMFGKKAYAAQQARKFIQDFMQGNEMNIKEYGRHIFINKDGQFSVGDGWISLREKQMAMFLISTRYPSVKRLGFFGPYMLERVRIISNNWNKNERLRNNSIEEMFSIFEKNYKIQDDTFFTIKSCDKLCIVEDLGYEADAFRNTGNNSYKLALTLIRHGLA